MHNFTEDNYEDVVRMHIDDWSRRSRSKMLTNMGPGCFLWDAAKDGFKSSGMFFKYNIIPKYLNDNNIVLNLQEMINNADLKTQIVVYMIFGKKGIALTLSSI